MTLQNQWMPRINDRFVASHDYFGKVHTVIRKTKSKEQIYIYDENNNRHPIEQCHRYNPEAPLDDASLKTLIDMATAIVEDRCVYSLARFEDLTVEQKKQLWGVLTQEQREVMKDLREGRSTSEEQAA